MGALRLAAVGVGTLLISAAAAQAQVQSPGFFGHIDGQYFFDPASGGTAQRASAPPGFNARRPGNGWGGDAQLGVGFAGRWDLSLVGRYVDLSKGKSDAVSGGPGPFGWHATDARIWNVGTRVGYTFGGGGFGIRPFLGALYIDSTMKFRDNQAPIFATKVNAYGFGPQIGFDAAFKLFGPISFTLGGDGAVLFGRIKDNKNAAWLAATAVDGRAGRTFFNLNGRAGLDWQIVPLLHFAAGYKVEWLSGIGYDAAEDLAGGRGPVGKSDLLLHGPYVRLAYNIGVPKQAVARPAPAPPPKPPAVAMSRSYMVFFEFDRSNLTANASDTIRQAADAVKAGGSPRVNVTGHADRSGNEPYNMALSLRRANTVRDELVRLGVPAASIVIVGRGETQPLVATPDGVREPQNRRVEIVLN